MATIQSPNLRKAIGDFLTQYLTPEVKKGCVLWGNQNNIALPAKSNEYVIYFLLSTQRHGSNITTYDSDGETTDEDVELEYTVQVDCYAGIDGKSDGDNAQQRAQTLEILSRSLEAYEYLKKYGLHVLYVEPPRDTTIVDDDNTYIRRWTVTLHLAGHTVLTLDSPGFTEVSVKSNVITTQDQAETQDPASNVLGVSNLDTKFKTNGES